MGIFGILWVFDHRVNTYNLGFYLQILIEKSESKREHWNLYLEKICQINYKPGSVI